MNPLFCFSRGFSRQELLDLSMKEHRIYTLVDVIIYIHSRHIYFIHPVLVSRFWREIHHLSIIDLKNANRE